MKKKLSAILLTLCLLFSLCPPLAFADGTGKGTQASPYLVSTQKELEDAAKKGGYIHLQNNIVVSSAVTLTKSVVIDGTSGSAGASNGEGCYSISAESALSSEQNAKIFSLTQDSKDVSIVFRNLQILGPTGGYSRGISSHQAENVDITLENVKLTAGYYALNIASKNKNVTVRVSDSLLEGWCAFQLWSSAKVTVTDSELIGRNDKNYNADGWNDFSTIVINQDTVGSVVNVSNSTIRAVTEKGNRQELFGIQNILNDNQRPPTDNSLTFTGCTFESEGKYKVVKDGQPYEYDLPLYYNAEYGNHVTVDGKSIYVPETGAIYDELLTPVARIGQIYFGSLATAASAAKSGDVITLLKSTEGAGVVVEGESGRTLTFDLNGFTYTVTNPTVGSPGTETNGFQLLRGSNITFRNGAIKAGSSAKILFQNYSNLTLENVTVDCRESAQCQYVLSNNFGNIVVKGNTNLYAAKGQAAFDLYFWPSNGYGDGVTVTFDETMTGTVSGRIEYGRDSSSTDADSWQEKTRLVIENGHFDAAFAASSAGALDGANIVISGGYFNFDPTPYLAAGKITVPSSDPSYRYMTADKTEITVNVESSVAENQPDDSKLAGVDQSEKTELIDAAESVQVDELLAYGASEANKVTQSQADAAVRKLQAAGLVEESEKVTLYVQTYLDVTPQPYAEEAGNKILTLDISPKYQIVASTAEDAEHIELTGADRNAVVYKKGDLKITSTVNVSIELPTDFSVTGATAYVLHAKSETKQYVYDGEVKNNILTFINPNGFSDFTVYGADPSVARVEGGKGYMTLQEAVNAVEENGTIFVKQSDSATVSRPITFTVKTEGNANATITAGGSYKESQQDNDDGSVTYTFSRKSSTSDDAPSLGYRLPSVSETTGGKNFVSDTTSNLTVNGKYQFRITSTDGHKPVMTVSNSNFTVELASQSGNDYFYVIRCAGAAGSTANVLVDGYQVVVATVGTAGVVSDTTHPFTVAQGAAYQFKLTSASRPTFTGNNANFTIAYVSNSGNDWFFKVTAAGAAGASTTFSANGVVVTTATIA